MVSGEPALYETRVACQWDDERFYVAYWAEEPQVRATLTERDSFVWNDNDVELFVAGDDCYYELEVNAFGTVYEAFFVWQDALRRGSRFDRPELDLYSRNVDLLGGFQDASRWGRHPRGRRFAFLDFDLAGLETAVRVDGRINDPATTDRGWTVEMALPWRSLAFLFDGRTLPAEGGRDAPLRLLALRGRARPRQGPCPRAPGGASTPTASTTRTSRRASASSASRASGRAVIGRRGALSPARRGRAPGRPRERRCRSPRRRRSAGGAP